MKGRTHPSFQRSETLTSSPRDADTGRTWKEGVYVELEAPGACGAPVPEEARDGSLAYQAYSDNPNDRINSVSRGELSLLLINAASRYPNVKFNFDHRCTNIDFKKPAITFLATRSNKLVTAETDLIIGADGAFSAVRLQMMLNMDRFEYRQDYLEYGYKELMIPPAAGGGFAMQQNALHIANPVNSTSPV